MIRPRISKGIYANETWHWDKTLKCYVLLGRLLTREEYDAAQANCERMQVWNSTLHDTTDPHYWPPFRTVTVDVAKEERKVRAKAGAVARAAVKEEAA